MISGLSFRSVSLVVLEIGGAPGERSVEKIGQLWAQFSTRRRQNGAKINFMSDSLLLTKFSNLKSVLQYLHYKLEKKSFFSGHLKKNMIFVIFCIFGVFKPKTFFNKTFKNYPKDSKFCTRMVNTIEKTTT